MTLHIRDSAFIISCSARTGSTFLVHLLRSNPQILCHGEVIDHKNVGALTGTYGKKRREIEGYDARLNQEMQQHPARFLFANVFDSQGYRVVGFKYKTDESLDPSYKAYTDTIVDNKDIKVIHLKRRNLLDVFISHEVVLKQTGLTMLKEGETPPAIQPFSASPAAVVDYFRGVVGRETKAESMYSGHRHMFVEYEDITKENSEARQTMQRFLDVAVVKLQSPTKKIIGDNKALLVNAPDVVAALKAAGFENRLA